jgi:hypothetical protein
MNLANENTVFETISDIIFSNDPGVAAKVISIALIRLESGNSFSAQEALDYACEKILEHEDF